LPVWLWRGDPPGTARVGDEQERPTVGGLDVWSAVIEALCTCATSMSTVRRGNKVSSRP
jgi:hypothetical protein